MLTEYSTYDDIRRFRDKVLAKFEKMRSGWLGREIHRQIIEWERQKGDCYLYSKSFKLDNQIVYIDVAPMECCGRAAKRRAFICIRTFVQTNHGVYAYSFERNNKMITIHSPHWSKRIRERCGDKDIDTLNTEQIPYERDGELYELHIHYDTVTVCKKVDDDIVIYVTALHRDMCTGKNYQALFDRIGNEIDKYDIYKWK